ncbi:MULTISPECIES: DsbC family protein [unclassified Oleiphilus]|jgi:thiol:disulfide interchange protein DsbC|uniref:DsbC family protein n=2 Tax=Oleiphilus TaxID=141450 RepID=UPI0008399155|nr:MULTISPECIES: DsbC family protein [unclassified Oleiphilus]
MRLVRYIICLSLLFSLTANADEAQVRKSLSEAMPGLKLSSVEMSEIVGMYRVTTYSGEALFVSSDGKFFLTGDLYATKTGRIENLTEKRRETARIEQISSVQGKDKIVFPAKGETKARIAVFTDIDCGYCRKLHREIPALNDMGIEVSYLAYPRAGVGSDSYGKYVSAWCAEDKLEAMTDAKNGKSIPEKTCANPVQDQYMLGQAMGISGTPAIVLESGRLIPGYLNAQKLGKALGVL